MSWLTLLTSITLTWVLWAIGGAVGVWADIRERKRPNDAGFSIAPVIPVFPLVFFGGAMLLNIVITPWGTRIISGFHALLVVLFLVVMLRDLRRGFSAKQPTP